MTMPKRSAKIDLWTQLVIVGSISTALCTCVCGAIGLQIKGEPIPGLLAGIATTSIGALTKIATESRKSQPNSNTEDLKQRWKAQDLTPTGYLAEIFSTIAPPGQPISIADPKYFCETWSLSLRTYQSAKAKLIQQGRLLEHPTGVLFFPIVEES
jgi:hypothetical protein